MRQLGFQLFDDPDWGPPRGLPKIDRTAVVGLDIETKDDGLANGVGPGWATGAGHIAGVSLAQGDWREYYPLRHPDTENFPEDQFYSWLAEAFGAGVRFSMHNAPYDMGWLCIHQGMPYPRQFDDTMGMASMVDEARSGHRPYSLDTLSGDLLGHRKDEKMLREAGQMFGLTSNSDLKSNLWRMPARFVAAYAAEDAWLTLQLRHRLLAQIDAQQLGDAYQLELDIMPCVLEMRRRGIRVNVDRALEAQVQVRRRRDALLRAISERTGYGRPVSMTEINSKTWLMDQFDAVGIDYPRTPPSKSYPEGQPSFESDWLLQVRHWLPRLLVKIRRTNDMAEKFLGTYILNHCDRGRIHAEVHQYRQDRGGTVSTRFAYSNPPLQQMPSRDPVFGPMIRGVFEPEEGELWAAPDYSQQEYRLIVHFAAVAEMLGVEEALRTYQENPDADFHQMVSDMTGLPRKPAKDANFAKAFGAGPPKFALMTARTVDEAVEIMSQYDEKLPFVRRLSEFCQGRASSRGYIRLLDGARAHFDTWEPRMWKLRSEFGAPLRLNQARERLAQIDAAGERLVRAFTHKAMNRLIQGSAARQTKMALRECWRMGEVPLLQMHDELDFSLDEERRGIRIAEAMRDVVKLEVPMKVDLEWGVNWGDARWTYSEALARLRARAAA